MQITIQVQNWVILLNLDVKKLISLLTILKLQSYKIPNKKQYIDRNKMLSNKNMKICISTNYLCTDDPEPILFKTSIITKLIQ